MALVCRTCLACRRRKVKCDGCAPKCGSCRSRAANCDYPEDARRSGTRQRNQKSQRPSHAIPTSSETAVTAPPNPSQNTRVPSARDRDNEPAAHALDEILTNSTSTRARAQLPVYGATSLLHDRASDASFEGGDDMKAADISLMERIQDRLVANAAIRKQQELLLYTEPSMVTNIDFDGLPADLALHLINMHWSHQHFTFLLTYRPAVMHSLITDGPHVNKLLLNALYLSSSLYSERFHAECATEQASAGERFFKRMKILLPDYIDQPSTPTIVALLIAGSCLVPHGQQSAGWMFCGIAYRMITDLGCHMNVSPDPKVTMGLGLTATDVEARRRLYWGAFIVDKFQSLFLGRLPVLDARETNIPASYLDTYEELQEWHPLEEASKDMQPRSTGVTRGRPAYAISSLMILIHLCDISSRIMTSFYSIRSRTSKFSLLRTRNEIRVELTTWLTNIPEHLRFQPDNIPAPPPHQMTPMFIYWTLVILSEQPFLKAPSSASQEDGCPRTEARERCMEAALKIWHLVQAYEETYTLARAQYGHLYAAYCAVFVIVYQDTERQSPEQTAAAEFFLRVLSKYRRGCFAGLKKPLELLELLMRRCEVPSPGREQGSPDTVGMADTTVGASSRGVKEVGRPSSAVVSPDEDVEWTAWLRATDDGGLFDTDGTIWGMFMPP